MKCPKCGYLGFERVERCRNCGYDFPIAQPRGIPELPLRGVDGDHLGLLDLNLGNDRVPSEPDTPRSAVRAGAAHAIDDLDSTADLPLFGSAATDIRPIGSRPLPPRPPLAVRRASPEIPRVRVEQPRASMLDLGVVEPEPGARSRPAPRIGEQAGAATESASLVTRGVAGLIDLVVLAVVDGFVIYFTLQICGLTIGEIGLLPKGPLLAFLILQNGGYLVAFTVGGQTLGKMALGIRVVPASGASRVDLGRSTLRTLVWGLMAMPVGLGFVSTLLDPDRRGWHDRCANTRVVRASAA